LIESYTDMIDGNKVKP